MNNLIAFLLLAGFFALLFIGLKENKKEQKEVSVLVQTGHTLVQYLGGSPYLSDTSEGAIKPKDNGLSYAPKSAKAIFINWHNIKSVETKTHEQITQDITAGRILLLGVFALAAKKQTVHRSEYLIIHCTESSVNYDMVFSGNNIGSLASQINKALIQYRKLNLSSSMEQAGI